MDVTRVVQRLIEPLRNRVRGMIVRGFVQLVDDARLIQELQASEHDGEVAGQIERFQEYGFTSVPHAPSENGQGAEALIVHVGGTRDIPVAVACGDRRYRLKGLEAGEVAMYDDRGGKVHLERDGITVDHPDRVTLTVGSAKLELDTTSAELSFGSNRVTITAAGVEIVGDVIDLNP